MRKVEDEQSELGAGEMDRPSRMHVAVGVTSLQNSKEFYSRLFGRAPSIETDDQIDWLLEEPAVHFSIFYNPAKPIGVEHIGVDFTGSELPFARKRMETVDLAVKDPDGLRVEIYSKDQAQNRS